MSVSDGTGPRSRLSVPWSAFDEKGPVMGVRLIKVSPGEGVRMAGVAGTGAVEEEARSAAAAAAAKTEAEARRRLKDMKGIPRPYSTLAAFCLLLLAVAFPFPLFLPVVSVPSATGADKSYLSSLPGMTLAAWTALILAIQDELGWALRTVRSSSEL